MKLLGGVGVYPQYMEVSRKLHTSAALLSGLSGLPIPIV
jgi:hypothetical protein